VGSSAVVGTHGCGIESTIAATWVGRWTRLSEAAAAAAATTATIAKSAGKPVAAATNATTVAVAAGTLQARVCTGICDIGRGPTQSPALAAVTCWPIAFVLTVGLISC